MTSHMYERPKEGTKGSVEHASFTEALIGGVGSSSACFYIWEIYYGADMTGCLAKKDYTFLSCLSRNQDEVNPWGNLVVAVVIISILTFISSWVLRFAHGRSAADPSVVDRLWSIVPWCYAWYMCYAASSSGTVSDSTFQRLLIMAVLSTLWGARLTWNFARKGGFSGGEDYRWVEVQSWMAPWQFEVFNLVFITTYQHYLLLAITTPLAVVWQAGAAGGDAAPLGSLDYFAAGLYALLIFGEYTADCQMFDFQTEKYRRKNAGEALGEYKKGFITTGLWAWSRHPNYFCEVSLWWTFYLFGVAASGEWLNPSIIGCILLTVLFVPPKASLDTTEGLSSRKYPEYKEYQKTTARFVPWFPKV